MGQISKILAARFASIGKHLSSTGEESKRLRESAQIPKDVKTIKQLVDQGMDPLHATYVSAQNFTSLFAENVSAFEEFDPYFRILSAAEDEYLPSSPPISPLTISYFTTWAFFDVRFGPDLETIGTCVLDIGGDLGMDQGMVETTRLFQNTRMGIYEHCGQDGSKVRLRELLTDQIFLCQCASGYAGNTGELWYVRLCPPVISLIDYHVVFTTPYVLVGAGKADWTAYLKKQLLGHADAPQALHDFMKYGPTLNHWNEFVFQGYHHHQFDAIFLAGLPDVKGSLPHASELKLETNYGATTHGQDKHGQLANAVTDEQVGTRPSGQIEARAPGVYQLKITLKGIQPPIWRRVIVPDCTLDDLHEIIQIAMGWANYHLYCFRIGPQEFTRPDMAPGELMHVGDATEMYLRDVIEKEKQKFNYQYDFGDDWRHEIVVEKILKPVEGQSYPLCVKGRRACPPEDVGGAWGYAQYLDATADPHHERHKEFLECRGKFEPEAFDLDAVNRKMTNAFR